jgi:hypothetical protein
VLTHYPGVNCLVITGTHENIIVILLKRFEVPFIDTVFANKISIEVLICIIRVYAEWFSQIIISLGDHFVKLKF